MADKGGPVKCEECGARNELGVRRCRVCANLLDLEAPEQRKGLALSPGELEAIANAHAIAEEQGLPTADRIEFDQPGITPFEYGDGGSRLPPPPGAVDGGRAPHPSQDPAHPEGTAIEFDLPGVEPLRLPGDDEPVAPGEPISRRPLHHLHLHLRPRHPHHRRPDAQTIGES